ncbi:hypothetical protein HAHI6034_10440 [Hathewaya histolytica]|uniref:Type 11 methyltransferase n=1 Tax=Hathewaya histolytica TaxID=1498 RepID=A0A4U9RI69_HATHI|nr:hypothetical protein [Hathewaya histolytica]VTQ91509.1 type 11 methyltransferase [Hathewaya histolytica]
MYSSDISVWELLQKQITWNQLNFIQDKKLLDFGSGRGIAAPYFGSRN